MARKKTLSKRKKIIKTEIDKPIIIEAKPATPRFICPQCGNGMTIIKEVSNETVLKCPKCYYNMAITG